MPFSASMIEEIEKLDPGLRGVFIALLKEIEQDREERITMKEFMEFAERTEENFQKVWKSIDSLAEAQERTEERLGTLAEAQERTEERLGTLAEAQKRTEEELGQLVLEHRETRRQLGGLTQTVGYTLENESYKFLPRLLAKDHGIALKEKLRRGYLQYAEGRDIEVNILGKGELGGKEILILGECKSQLSKNDVDTFIRKKLERVKEVAGAEIFPVLVTHMISQRDVEAYARRKGIPLYYSYDFVEAS
jgi:hypothetical protein